MTVKAKITPPPKRRRNTCGRCGEVGHNRQKCKAKNPPKQPPRWRRYMDRNRAEGLCVQCSEPAVNARHCDRHRREANEKSRSDRVAASAYERRLRRGREKERKERAEREAKGLCVACGERNDSNKKHCLACLEIARGYYRKGKVKR